MNTCMSNERDRQAEIVKEGRKGKERESERKEGRVRERGSKEGKEQRKEGE